MFDTRLWIVTGNNQAITEATGKEPISTFQGMEVEGIAGRIIQIASQIFGWGKIVTIDERIFWVDKESWQRYSTQIANFQYLQRSELNPSSFTLQSESRLRECTINYLMGLADDDTESPLPGKT